MAAHLPEHTHYRDTGCSYAPSCLRCDLPVCRHDLPSKRARTYARVARLQALLTTGHTLDECLVALGISRRTYFRLLRYPTPAPADTLPVIQRIAP